ncbi:MAG: TlyA family RNA methyltransferase [bacterium]|nr:TlyA family RNA methyltransferase [bacterium]
MTGKKPKSPKNRLDAELVNRGLLETVEKARAYIMAGDVLVQNQVVYKADTKITPDHVLRLKEKSRYVSRGAEKIAAAFELFRVEVTDTKNLDVGVSTGGFSDYMLQHGALHVTGVDVNIQQVDDSLRSNDRVTLLKLNARHLEKTDLAYQPNIVTIDVSFISITKILPALTAFPNARILSLVKPQFEVKKERVGKGGIIADKTQRLGIVLELKQKIEDLGYAITGFTRAGVKGRKGNQEYFFLLEYGKKISINDKMIHEEFENEI